MGQYRETIAAVRATLQTLSLDTQALLAAAPHCAELQGALDLVPQIAGLAVADTAGRVRCATNPDNTGLDLSGRDYMQLALKGIPNLSSLTLSQVSNTPSIVVAEPVVNEDGDVDGVIMARVQLDMLFPITVISDLDISAALLMIDAEGNLIESSPAPSPGSAGSLRDTPLGDKMLSRSSGTFEGPGPDGVTRIYGFTRLPESNMRLAVGLSAAALTDELRDSTLRAGLIFLAVCALIFLGLWLAGDRLVVRPVRQLAARLAEFGRDTEAGSAMPATRITELEPLVVAVGEMSQRLTERETALRGANQKLMALASRDPLTDLPNRRAFDEALRGCWDEPVPVALLMIDIDHFKEFNDQYGHSAGDSALRRVAAALAREVRTGDVLARIGGEEFVALLPGSGEGEAARIASRLRRAVEHLAIAHARSPFRLLTVSIGYAGVPAERVGQPGELLIAADRALYAAKAAGRNAIHAWTKDHGVDRGEGGANFSAGAAAARS
nr:diguanylate cyclase [Ancylobacter crimeensis]